MTSPRETRRALIVMILLVLLWGYTFIVVKVALRHASAFDVSVMRVVLGSLSLFAFVLWARAPWRPQHFKSLLVVGLLQTTAFTILQTLALVSGEPGKTSILIFTMPFWVIAFAWPVLGERIHGWQWPALASAMTGLILIVQPWNFHASAIGKGLAVIAGICWALSVVIVKSLHTRSPVDIVNFTFWQMLIGSIPVVVLERTADASVVQWNPTLAACALFIGIGSTGLGWVMWFYVLRRLPAGTTSLSSLGIPVVATISSWLQFGERPGALETAGMLLIGLALALVSWLTVRQRETQGPATAQLISD